MAYSLPIVGLSYVGLSMSIFIANKGFRVVDIDEKRITMFLKYFL